MKKCLFVLLTTILVKGSCATSDNMVVTCTVDEINELSVSLTTIPILDIISIPSGQLFASETNSDSTYLYTTNEQDKKITAVIDQSMPFLTTLEIQLDASPGRGTSTGTQVLTTSSVDVVTGIDRGFQPTGQTITYTFTVTLGATPFDLLTRVVTLSLIDE